jgi:hypothetical protein
MPRAPVSGVALTLASHAAADSADVLSSAPSGASIAPRARDSLRQPPKRASAAGSGAAGGGGAEPRRDVKMVLAGLRARFANARGALRETFRAFDADASGSIDPQELKTALHSLGYSVIDENDAKAVIAA